MKSTFLTTEENLGQYYTPEYIVEYIVKKTLGYVVKYKELSDIKILDPAIGMGIFLKKAYEFLGTIHKEKNQWNEIVSRRIIANNLYGVDLDSKQVLYCIENLKFSNYSLNIKEADFLVPPPNIRILINPKYSKSLFTYRKKIARDFIRQGTIDSTLLTKLNLLENQINQKIQKQVQNFYQDSYSTVLNPWTEFFPEVEKWDVIIGNPPWGADLKRYNTKLFNLYQSGGYQVDSWALFLEQCLKKLTINGRLGFVIPNTFLINENYNAIRKIIVEEFTINYLMNLGENVFKGVSQPSMIIILENKKPEKNDQITVVSNISKKKLFKLNFVNNNLNYKIFQQSTFRNNLDFQLNIFSSGSEKLLKQIENGSELIHEKTFRLGTLVTNARGVELNKKGRVIQCSKCGWWNPPLLMRKSKTPKRVCGNKNCENSITLDCIEDVIVKTYNFKDSLPFLTGKHIHRYWISPHYFIDPSRLGIQYKDPRIYKGPKLLLRKTGHGIRTVIDYENRWVNQVVYIFQLKSLAVQNSISLEYLLGVLNSKLIHYYYYQTYADPFRNTFPHFTQKKFLNLPIRMPVSSDERQLVKEIAKQAQFLQSKYHRINNLNNSEKHSGEILRELNLLETRLNLNVFLLYGISMEDQDVIKDSLNHFAKLRESSF